VASQNFLDDAATPPCGDARRGISLACSSVRSFNRERIPSFATLSKRERDLPKNRFRFLTGSPVQDRQNLLKLVRRLIGKLAHDQNKAYSASFDCVQPHGVCSTDEAEAGPQHL